MNLNESGKPTGDPLNPDRIDVLKDNESEIVVMMSYKKQQKMEPPVVQQTIHHHHHPMNQPMNQSMNQPMNQSMNTPTMPQQVYHQANHFAPMRKQFQFPDGICCGDPDDIPNRVTAANYAEVVTRAKLDDTMRYLVKGKVSEQSQLKDLKGKPNMFELMASLQSKYRYLLEMGSTINHLRSAMNHSNGRVAQPGAGPCDCPRCRSQNTTGAPIQQPLNYQVLNKYREEIRQSVDQLGENKQMEMKPKSTSFQVPMTGSNSRPSSPVRHTDKNSQSKLVKQQYVALCIPSVAVQNEQSNSSQFQIRYYNPETGEFKKPTENEIVALPVSLIQKSDVNQQQSQQQQQQPPPVKLLESSKEKPQCQHTMNRMCANCSHSHNCNQNPSSIMKQNSSNQEVIELSMDELNSIITLAREKERQSKLTP